LVNLFELFDYARTCQRQMKWDELYELSLTQLYLLIKHVIPIKI